MGNSAYSFLAWNLVLAWLPLISAFFAYGFQQKVPGRFRPLLVVGMGVWLVFLPNAPYLITDLVHLTPNYSISFWFDLTMFLAFAGTGLLLGLISLHWMQRVVANMTSPAASWLFVFGATTLSSFGVYLGRYLRWNSWDLLSNPTGLLVDIWENVRHPILHFQTFAFSGLFTLILIAAYLMLNVLTHLQQER
ncbi:MAG TPA: DUF1361 domain-containing protein [Aggregatilineales bacterium]|nr:DUF1361 domain-containing protein [Aggregatilineales bacterium]